MEPKPMITPDLAGLIRTRPKPSARAVAQPIVAAEPPAEQESQPSALRAPSDEAPSPSIRVSAERRARRAPRPAASLRQSARDAPSPSAGTGPTAYTRSISLYLPRSVHTSLRLQAQARGISRTALILKAVNAHHESLGEWLTPDSDPQDAAGGLFAVPQDSRAAEPVMQTALRVTDAQLSALDDLATRFGIRRSHVMVAALRAELNRMP